MAFGWFKPKDNIDNNNVTKQPRRDCGIVDFTESLQANTELTRGLYHNTYPGLKLAGGLAFAPIAVPIWFMGLPTPDVVDDDFYQELLDGLVREFTKDLKQIHVQSHREGTIWVFPKWSAKINNLVWEFIRDDVVTDILKDIDTGEIVEIITKEQIKVSTGHGITANVTRKKSYTREKTTITWEGAQNINASLKDKSSRNTLEIMPIPFSNNNDAGETRGHSDYERVLPDFKNYHDIDLAWSTMLAKFSVKWIQEGSSNAKTWLDNNGFDSILDIDISKTDFIYNIKDSESTEFVFPDRAYEAYDQKLKNIFRKIVEASGVPEIAWGLKTEGNRASVEENMEALIKYVQEKQAQKREPYIQLFTDSLRILAAVNLRSEIPQIDIKWNKLDAVSDEVRSTIFMNFARGVSAIVGTASLTKEQLHKLWLGMYPEATEDDYNNFKRGLSDMGGHKQWTNANYFEVMDEPGDRNLDDDNEEQ